jgi:hypothetical protein
MQTNLSRKFKITIKTLTPQLAHKIQQTPNSKYHLFHQTRISTNNIEKNKMTIQTNNKPSNYNYYNKKALLKCGDIESNPGPRHTLLLNHPQMHHELIFN